MTDKSAELATKVAHLDQLIHKLPESRRDFARSLVWTFSRKGLTSSQAYWIGRLIKFAETGATDPKSTPKFFKKDEVIAPPAPRAVAVAAPAEQPYVDIAAILDAVKPELQAGLDHIRSTLSESFNESARRVIASDVLTALDARIPRRVEIVVGGKVASVGDLTHKQFVEILQIVSAGIHVCLVGPAGSGKTTVCEQLAKALELEFYFSGQMTGAHELTGFVDAHGKYLTTPFREAFEKGGLWLCDEIDGSDPSVPCTLNAALANGQMTFPDTATPVKRHPNFRCVAAANTYGRGADRVYVGRNQLDGAFLDRYVFVDFDYDYDLERRFTCNDAWVRRVQSLRDAALAEKARVIISPRASVHGAKLLACGMSQSRVEEIAVWKGIDLELRRRIENRAR